MSGWQAIETTIKDALTGIMIGESAALATVKGQTHQDRRALTASISRELLPAAYVVTTGREASEKTHRRPGRPELSVLLATSSLRDDDESRIGSEESAGLFDLSEAVANGLQDLVIGSDLRLLLVDEKPVGGEEIVVVWEQRYEVRRRSEATAPTFGGIALAGTDSEVSVELGVLRRASSSFSFPGIEGVFERSLGARGRAILWRGQLRAATDSAMNALESVIENEVRVGTVNTMVDAWSRPHGQCVVKSFTRRGPRSRDALSGQALQDFEIEFTQLGI